MEDKTRRLFELDLVRLRRATLLVSYIDGLAKDEGVCFEIGYAYASGAAILLISTDFFDVELPNGEKTPLDPLLCAAATPAAIEAGHQEVFLDFGGTIYEWQELLQDELERMIQPKVGLTLVRARRYDTTSPRRAEEAAALDLARPGKHPCFVH